MELDKGAYQKMNEEKADLFDKTEDQIDGMYNEISILSKKKPDGPINKFKLRLINSLLKQANDLMGKHYLPFGDFSEFDEDDIPSASDVVLILSQYMKSMDRYRYDHTKMWKGTCYWVLDDEELTNEAKVRLLGVIL